MQAASVTCESANSYRNLRFEFSKEKCMSPSEINNLQLPGDNLEPLNPAVPVSGTCDGTYCQTGYHPSA